MNAVLGQLAAALPRPIRKAVRRLLGRPAEPRQLVGLAFVILLGEELDNFIRKLQVRLEEEHGLNRGLSTPPHITLKLGCHVTSLAPFEGTFDRLVPDVEPFEVAVQNIAFFDEGVVYLDVEPNPRLAALQGRILDDLAREHGVGPDPLEEPGRFHFHVTVAHGLTEAEFKRAQKTLDRGTPRFVFRVEQLALLCHTRGFWFTYKRVRIPAGGAAA